MKFKKNKFIPLSIPNLIGNEKKYLKNCIKTSYVSTVGEYVNKFEKKLSKFLNVRYAVSCNSGTSALHLALRVAGVEPKDEVIVPTMSFIATANAVRYLDASPVFIDCDKFFNLDYDKTKSFLLKETFSKNGKTFNKKTNRKISALIVVHVFGNAANIKEILALCKKKKIKVIEDAAGALGTKYLYGKLKNRYAGTVGDLGCISFNGNKIITSGGGGVIITNSKELAKKSFHLSTQASVDKLNYEHDDIGFNYRLTNLQASVGLAQLEKIKTFLGIKKKIKNFYSSRFKNLKNFTFNNQPPYADNNCWMLSINCKKHLILKKEYIINFLYSKGIETRSIWKPLHLQKPYKKYQRYNISNSERIFNNTILVPSSTNLKKSDLLKVISTLKKISKN